MLYTHTHTHTHNNSYLYCEDEFFELYKGKMEEVLPTFESDSIDCICCDPPYELNFMNKSWDNTGVAFKKETWEHCFRVLKEGGYLLVFGSSKTYHRIACAIEDAGFQIKECILWVYSTGFPKATDIGLMIDKKNGVDNRTGNIRTNGKATNSGSGCYNYNNGLDNSMKKEFEERIAQNEWKGWTSCNLKPAYEPIIVARKPFKGSLVDNVLKNGLGAINIDECRVDNTSLDNYDLENRKSSDASIVYGDGRFLDGLHKVECKHDVTNLGRFPANIITDGSEEVEKLFPNSEQSNKSSMRYFKECGFSDKDIEYPPIYYCAKASREDREEGLDCEYSVITDGRKKSIDNPFNRGETLRKNIHPTVKPTELIQYLVRMFAPKGSVILDCFMGSGTTGKSCMHENRERNANYHFIGIEMTDEYLPICKGRIDYAKYKYEYEEKKEKEELKEKGITTIFDF